MAKRAVLFVDDEPNILAGLRTRLFGQRSRWEMAFITSGQAALDLMAEKPFDAVISDLRMPEMDGPALLAQVKARHPRVVRVVLSGQADPATSMRAASVAQQFLAKPCPPGVIESVVDRACDLRDLVNNEQISHIVGGIEALPPFPKVYSRLVALLNSEAVSSADVAGVLGQDMALCAKLLQMVNSAFFRLRRPIARIEEAVAYLGNDTVRQLVLAAEVFTHTGWPTHLAGWIDDLQHHSLLVSRLAASLCDEKETREQSAVAGLLHDIGQLVLAVGLPDVVTEARQLMVEQQCPAHVAEQAICGVSHAEVGGYLLCVWGLPDPIVEAVANHHLPQRAPVPEFGPLAATHVANHLVVETDGRIDQPLRSPLSTDLLARLGVAERLPAWRQDAARLVHPAA